MQINPEAVTAKGGGTIRAKLFGKPVVSGEVYEVPKAKTKVVKALAMSVHGRKMPMWVEVKTTPAETE